MVAQVGTEMNSQREKPAIEVSLADQSARQQGVAMGAALQTKIATAELSLLEFETFRRQQPWWMPFSVFQYMAQWRARTMLEPQIAQAFPHMRERIAGMAEGAGTTVEFLYLFHAMESANTSSAIQQPAVAACTALAATAHRTIDARPLIAHNFDLVASASPLLTLRENCSHSGLHFLAMSLAPMAGVIDGINEAGLAITYNYAPTTDICDGGPPISLSIDRALETCRTVNQAIEFLTVAPRGGGALLMLADAQGDIAALELSAHHAARRLPESDCVLSHSNAYQTTAMQAHEMPRTAVYGLDAPEALRGVTIFESAEQRDERMAEQLRKADLLSLDAVGNLMSDHGCSGEPTANTICMHGAHWSTLASVQLLPAERRIRVAYGTACEAEFEDFQL